MKPFRLIALSLPLLLAACHTLDRYEWVGPTTLRGAGGLMKKEEGLEIWVQGEPNRDYIPIKVVETMTSGTIGVETYLFRILKKETTQLRGDGFILLTKDARSGGTYVAGTAATNSIGSIYGNTVTSNSTTTVSAIAVPIQYNTYRALVFRYKKEATFP
jgi:hypothetical protein